MNKVSPFKKKRNIPILIVMVALAGGLVLATSQVQKNQENRSRAASTPSTDGSGYGKLPIHGNAGMRCGYDGQCIQINPSVPEGSNCKIKDYHENLVPNLISGKLKDNLCGSNVNYRCCEPDLKYLCSDLNKIKRCVDSNRVEICRKFGTSGIQVWMTEKCPSGKKCSGAGADIGCK